jgi:hypothetical protein
VATLAELSQRLLKRFKGVPNITIEDATDWAEESMLEHGYTLLQTVPTESESLILLYAQAEGARQISISTAHFFVYKDSDEQIDKSKISEQYRKLALDLKSNYDQKKSEGVGGVGGSRFKGLTRADR